MKDNDNVNVFTDGFYRQSIRIGRNVTKVIALPCVRSVRKAVNGTLAYEVEVCGKSRGAVEGDWLCEDRWGNWHMVRKGFEKLTDEVNRDIVDICGFPARMMTNGTLKGKIFSTEAVMDMLEDNPNAEAECRFYGFVEDWLLFTAPKEVFEDYVTKCWA